MKRLFLLIILVIFSVCIYARENENVINNKDVSQIVLLKQTFGMPNSTVVAVVGDTVITKGDLMLEVWKMNANKVLDTLINQKLLEQGFAKEKIFVKPNELESEINGLPTQYGCKDLDEFLTKANISLEDLTKEIRTALSLKKLIDKKFVLDNEKLKGYMKPAHILIKFDPSITNEVEREEACKKKIDEIYEKVKAGEDFAALAKEYSEDSSKTNGGSLGWVDASVNFVPEFKAAMLPLQAGEYSEPVKSQYGYHIIKMDARGDSAKGEELDALIQKEKNLQSNNIINAWFEQLKKDFPVDNKLIPTQVSITDNK